MTAIKILPIPANKDRLNIPVSMVEGSTNANIYGHKTLKKVLNEMVDPKNSTLIGYTKKLIAARDKPIGYSKLKNDSCAGFILGSFLPPRKDANCETYVPLLGFDVDNLENEYACKLTLTYCKKIPEIFLAYPSPSGKGLRIFVWCKSTPDTHKAVYESVCEHLSESLMIPIDKAVRKELKAKGVSSKEINKELKKHACIDTSTKNISRIWFYIHLDKSEIYLNKDSKVFESAEVLMKELLDSKRPQLHAETAKPLDEAEKIRICAKMAAQRNILAGRNNGLFFICCLMVEHGLSESAITGYALGLQEIDFSESEIIKTVKSAIKKADPNKFGDAQMLAWCRNSEGVSPKTIVKPIVPHPKGTQLAIGDEVAEVEEEETIEEIEEADVLKDYVPMNLEDSAELRQHFTDKNLSAYLKIKPYVLTKYDFRNNVISNDIEYRLKGTDNDFGELTEQDIECEILNFGLKGSVDKSLMTLLRSTLYVKKFNPINYYFSELPSWDDSQPDHITNFSNYVIAKDQDWFNYQFKKMMVRSVACALNHAPFNKQCFTFLGKQNDGKTSFFRFLCPPSLKEYYKENIDITNKDGLIALSQNMFINFEELDALNKKELNKIKAMFTVDKIKIRPPYGRRDLNFPRVCNFLASSNRHEILTDETGNVRWLVFEILGIKHDNGGKNGYNKNVNIDLVWAQAYQLLKNGFKYNLTKEDLGKSEENNKAYQEVTIEMEWIQKIYEPSVQTSKEATFIMASDMLREIGIQSKNSRLTIRNVGKALRFLGFTKSQFRVGTEKSPRRGYWVKSNIAKNNPELEKK